MEITEFQYMAMKNAIIRAYERQSESGIPFPKFHAVHDAEKFIRGEPTAIDSAFHYDFQKIYESIMKSLAEDDMAEL